MSSYETKNRSAVVSITRSVYRIGRRKSNGRTQGDSHRANRDRNGISKRVERVCCSIASLLLTERRTAVTETRERSARPELFRYWILHRRRYTLSLSRSVSLLARIFSFPLLLPSMPSRVYACTHIIVFDTTTRKRQHCR